MGAVTAAKTTDLEGVFIGLVKADDLEAKITFFSAGVIHTISDHVVDTLDNHVAHTARLPPSRGRQASQSPAGARTSRRTGTHLTLLRDYHGAAVDDGQRGFVRQSRCNVKKPSIQLRVRVEHLLMKSRASLKRVECGVSRQDFVLIGWSRTPSRPPRRARRAPRDGPLGTRMSPRTGDQH